MDIHFITLCTTADFWWNDVTFIPRIGEKIWHNWYNDYYIVNEVRYENKKLVVITLDK